MKNQGEFARIEHRVTSEFNGGFAIMEINNKSTLSFYMQLNNKTISILGSSYVEFKIRLDDKIRFTNTFITDNCQLEIEIAGLK